MTRTILVVDDEPNYRALIEMQLADERCRVLTASCGAEAVQILKSENVDLLITDMKMPQMDGLDMLIEARKILPTVPAIIMTGYVIEDRLQRALSMNRTSHLPKPFNMDDLHRLVQETSTV